MRPRQCYVIARFRKRITSGFAPAERSDEAFQILSHVLALIPRSGCVRERFREGGGFLMMPRHKTPGHGNEKLRQAFGL